MNAIKKSEIKNYIYDRYTGQEVIEALKIDCSNGIKELLKSKLVVPKTKKFIYYQSYIDKLTLKDKEYIEELANQKRFYLIYKLLIDKWIKE